MKIKRIGPTVAFLTALTAAAGIWPAGCARTATAPPSAASEASAPTQLVRSETAPQTFLPHPAFAYAQGGESAVSVADIAERAAPSVVNVSSSRTVQRRSTQFPFFNDPFFRHFFGPGVPDGPPERRESGLGSGVILSADGIVLTNNHVIDKADDIRVTTADKREFDAEVVGTDAKSDLAVLRLKGNPEGLKPIEIGDSSRLRLGDIVLAIGNPFGVGQTITMGIVSAKGRANVGIVDYEDFIQTDAAINPGNSGGALVNMEGQLVGINTAILSRSGGYMGIGFAIPSNMAKPIMESLLKDGKVVRGWLGVGIQDVDQDLASALGLPSSSGVLVSEVMPGSPAAKAGLEQGDVVVAINGKAVDSTGRLRNVIAAAGAGQTVRLDVVRKGKRTSLDVELSEQPQDLGATGDAAEPGAGALDGLTLENLTPRNRQQYRIPRSVTRGVVIVGIEPGSAAAAAGLRPGDVVLEVNRVRVDGVASFKNAYQKSRDRVLLLLNRGGRTVYMVLKK